MKNLFLHLLPFLLLLPACTGHHGTAEAVQLDNGNRWQANPETTTGIAEMQAALARYEATSGSVSNLF